MALAGMRQTGGGVSNSDSHALGQRSFDSIEDVAGIKLARQRVAGLDKDALRGLADSLKAQIKSGVVILAAAMEDGKVSLIATVTPDLAKKAPAGQLVKQLAPIVGGGGGGRPDFAEAGGKDASRITELLVEARTLVEKLLK